MQRFFRKCQIIAASFFMFSSGVLAQESIGANESGTTENFQPMSDRTLIIVNNPEELISQDLGDNPIDPQHIFQQNIQGGKVRLFFEHKNGTGSPIGYGIRLFNPGNQLVNVTLEKKGFVPSVCGGLAFVNFFHDNSSQQPIPVPPQKYQWLWHTDTIKPGFFSGVVDFNWQSGTSLRIDTVAFQNFDSANKKNAISHYMGFITGQRGKTNQSHLYKGIVLYNDEQKSTDVKVDVGGFTLTNNDSNGVQLVDWYTHNRSKEPFGIQISPDLLFPNGQILKAPQANLGGWGIVYSINGWIANKSLTNRCVGIYMGLTASDHGHLAWWGNKKVWQAVELTPINKTDDCPTLHQGRGPNKDTIQYYSLNIPAGTARSFEAAVVAGGPSGTMFHHWIQTETCPTQQKSGCGDTSNAKLFGALAYSESTGMWGASWDCGLQDQAEQAAQMVCDQNDCEVGTSWFYGNRHCAAIARGDSGIYGRYGGEESRKDAEYQAFLECQKRGGTNCETLVWACNGDADPNVWVKSALIQVTTAVTRLYQQFRHTLFLSQN